MIGYVGNIEEKTLANSFFREVVFTGKYTQLVVMSLLPSEEIGMEVHPTVDQFFRIESGEGKVIMNGEEKMFKIGDAIIVPAGTNHNLINLSAEKELKLYTLYSPPNHPDGKIHKTKAEAMVDEGDHV
ncbi:MAG: cupin domain-containing protein [Candidatus Shapirobacteria bacterium]|nr:cupin domain-containing protein [Candidatus Shapirobacteria bacterium]